MRFGRLWGTASQLLHRLERQLRVPAGRSRASAWALPVSGFLLCCAILVVAGALSGVSAAEYIPTAMLEGLVIAGLFFVCMMPGTTPPDSDDGGGRGPDKDPTAAPPPFDPTLWIRVLDDPKPPSAVADSRDEARRELVGTRR